MRLALCLRKLPLCLAAAAMTLVLVATLSSPGGACDKNKSSATAAANVKASACPMSAACPASACSAMHSANASTASMSGACPHGANASTASMSGACPHGANAATASKSGACPHGASVRTASATTRTAAAHKASGKKARAKKSEGATAEGIPAHQAGLVAVLDPLTGGVVQATPEQLREFSATVKTGVSTSAALPDEPHVVRLADGTLMCDLPERLMMNAVAHRHANGKITFDCLRLPATGAAAATPSQPTSSTWAER